MPRPTKYSDEKAAAICKDIERGNTFRVAALVNGIHVDTLNEWRRTKPAFSAAIDAAEAKAQALIVNAIVNNAVAGDTKAAIFYLTHRHGDEWKPPKETTVLEGSEDKPLTVKILGNVKMADLH